MPGIPRTAETPRQRSPRADVSLRTADVNAILRDEDYATAATCQRGAKSGAQTHVTFGRNEPALHHYHSTFREALGMEPLPLEVS